MSKDSSFGRVFEIIKRLNNNETMNLTQLSFEYEVSERTIRRDFKLIEEVFGDFLIKNKGEFKAVENKMLNNVLSGSELGLIKTVFSLLNLGGVNTTQFKDLHKLVCKNDNVYQLTTRPFEDISKKEIFQKLEKAIKFNMYIEVNYIKDDSEFLFLLKPYKILFLNENFYLACENPSGKYPFLLLRIALIEEVSVLNKTFYKDSNLEKFINNIQTPTATYKPNSKNIEVEIVVPQDISRFFKLKKFLPTQEITNINENGDLNVCFKVTNYSEIEDLIIKWSPKITVVKPDNLKKYIKNKLIEKLEKF